MKKYEVLLKVASIITLVTGVLTSLFALLSLLSIYEGIANDEIDYFDFVKSVLEISASVLCIVGAAKGLKKKRNTYIFAILATIFAPTTWIIEVATDISLRNLAAAVEVILSIIFFLVCSLIYKSALDKGLDKQDLVTEPNQEIK